MKKSPRTLARALILASTLALAHRASANLIQNGDFTGVSLKTGYSGPALSSTLYGQFGTYSGSSLDVAKWNTSGYNFVYTTATADVGTQAGAAAGKPNQAPGAYNNAAGYGTTFMYGLNNGGTTAITGVPSGGNFIAADGAFGTAAVTQSLNSLTIGATYRLTFYWAGAQQQGFDGITTDNFTVNFGTQSFTTPTVTVAAHGFSGWMQQTYDFTAGATSQPLSFLAQGTPTGQPPFSLLGGVTLDLVPEFSHWAVFAVFGAACVGGEAFRRRRRESPLRASASAPVG